MCLFGPDTAPSKYAYGIGSLQPRVFHLGKPWVNISAWAVAGGDFKSRNKKRGLLSVLGVTAACRRAWPCLAVSPGHQATATIPGCDVPVKMQYKLCACGYGSQRTTLRLHVADPSTATDCEQPIAQGAELLATDRMFQLRWWPSLLRRATDRARCPGYLPAVNSHKNYALFRTPGTLSP